MNTSQRRIVSAEEARSWVERGGIRFGAPENLTDLAHTVVVQAEQIAAVRALHQPRHDGSWSLVEDAYCSCGTSEVRTMEDGYASLVPARYPCKTARALGATD